MTNTPTHGPLATPSLQPGKPTAAYRDLVDTSENKLGENTMAEHPLNADGDFYVEHGCCTSCDVPMQSAPSLFEYDET
ncbi:MAG: hypothetical protein WCP62_12340, partial [Planctomycetota bacterium]